MHSQDDINFLDLFLVLLRRKRLIFLFCFTALVLSSVVAFLLPNIYTSRAKILSPAENSSKFGGLLANAGDLATLAGLSLENKNTEMYVGLLESRTIADAVIDKFDLRNVYGTKTRVETYKELRENVSFEIENDRIITIIVDDKDPERAAGLANTFVEQLQRLNVQINMANAGRERVFLEERLKIVRQELAAAEEELQLFQQKNNAIRINEQAEAIIDAIASLKAELASKEIELGVALSYQTEQNPYVKTLKESINQLKTQLTKLERTPVDKGGAKDIFFPTSDVPQLGIQYARLMRDFKTQETLFEILLKQYELAKISEAKNTSTIQIIDSAVPADKKSKPLRGVIILVTTALFFFMGIMVAFFLEALRRLRPEDQEQLRNIKMELPWLKNKVS